MSAASPTVMAMTNPTQPTLEPHVLDEPCLRCGSAAVRVILYGPLDLGVEADVTSAGLHADAPIFDCRDCGFEWGEAVRDLLT